MSPLAGTKHTYLRLVIIRLMFLAAVYKIKLSFIHWESFCDIRPDCHHDFVASGTSNAMFDELA